MSNNHRDHHAINTFLDLASTGGESMRVECSLCGQETMYRDVVDEASIVGGFTVHTFVCIWCYIQRALARKLREA
jgi:hypothetical protein